MRYIVTLHLTGPNVSFYDCPGIEVCAVMESLIDWTPQVILAAGAGRPKMVSNILDTIAQSGGSFLEENIRGRAKFGGCPILGQR